MVYTGVGVLIEEANNQIQYHKIRIITRLYTSKKSHVQDAQFTRFNQPFKVNQQGSTNKPRSTNRLSIQENLS